MWALSGTRKAKLGVNVVVLAVTAALLTFIVPATSAQAVGNGIGPSSCVGNGWKALQTQDGVAMPGELFCVVYSLLGSLKRKQTVAITSTAPAPSAVGVTYRPTATATSGLPAAITLDSTSRGCTIAAGLVTLTAVGRCVIDADQAGNTVYGKAPRVKQSVTVVRAAQTITYTSVPPSPGVVGATYRPSATASSGLAVAITKDAASTGCTLTSGLVTFTGTGTCVIDAAQGGNANYLAAGRVKQYISVVKAAQTLSFTSAAPAPALVGASYMPAATATSGLPPAITLAAVSTGCTLTGAVVTFTGAGTCVINGNQAGNAAFSPAALVQQTMQVFKNAQSVSFTSTAPSPGTVGDSYTPTATTTSGLSAVFSLDSSSTGCNIVGGVVTFTQAGTCVINADQPGDSGNDSATQIHQTIPVVTTAQTVSFTTNAPTPATVGTQYTPTATTTSGLSAAITLDSSSTGCTLAGGVVTFTGTGTCVLNADQGGNVTYGAATRVQQSIQVVKQTQSIGFTSTSPTTATEGGTYAPTGTATSGLDVVFTLAASSAGCTLDHGLVNFTGAGTCVINANQDGNGDFAAAAQVQQSFAVTAAATVDGAPTAVADSLSVDRNAGPTTINVLANDTDTDGGPKTITDVTQPAHGTVAIAADGHSLTYDPTQTFCTSDSTGDQPDYTFTYTLNGGSVGTVSVKVTAVNEPPLMKLGDYITLKRGNVAPQPVTVFGDAVLNGIGNNVVNVFDVSKFYDPATCSGAGALNYHWVITYPNRVDPYAVAGITGYRGPVLTIGRNSMLEDAVGATFTLTMTSTVTGLSSTFDIKSLISSSQLTLTEFNICQGTLPGTCQIAAAKPAGPSDITLSNASVAENAPPGTTVGTLTAPDPDPQPSQTFSLIAGPGDDDDDAFTIDGTTLKSAASFDFATKPTYSVRIRVNSSAGFVYEKVFTINVTDVDDTPDVLPTAAADTATVNQSAGPTTIDVLANDTNSDGGPETITDVTQPDHGTVAIAADGQSVTYDPTETFCTSDASGDRPDYAFTYTLNGGSVATVNVKVTAPDTFLQPPLLRPGTNITLKRGSVAPQPVTVFGDGVLNGIGNNIPNVFDVSNFYDPATCSGALTYHWVVTYQNRADPYTVAGITGYQGPVLTIGRNSMLEDAVGATFTLTMTSPATGLAVTVGILSLISSSQLTLAIFNTCQGTSPGTCQIAAAGPAPPGTT